MTATPPRTSESRLKLALNCTYCNESGDIYVAFWLPTGFFMAYVFAAALLAGPILLSCAIKDISHQQCLVMDCTSPSTANVIVTSLCATAETNVSDCKVYKTRLGSCAYYLDEKLPCFYAGDHSTMTDIYNNRVFFHRPYFVTAIVLLSTSWPFVILFAIWGLYLCIPCIKREFVRVEKRHNSYQTVT